MLRQEGHRVLTCLFLESVYDAFTPWSCDFVSMQEELLSKLDYFPGWSEEVPTDRPLRIVFMGTPDFAVPTLQALLDGPHEVVSVYTQPDRPKGRGRKLQPPPVKTLALSAGLPVFQPDKMTSPEAYERFKEDDPDLAVVVAYGKILRPRILAVPRLGCINCHASLLPYYRGAAPIYWAIHNGEPETGVCTMWMNAGMDTGPELQRGSIDIGADETVGSVHDRLSALSASLLTETVDSLLKGDLLIQPQKEEEATYAPMLSKTENWINFDQSGEQVHNKIRALDPFPGARCLLPDDTQMKLFGSSYRPDVAGEPGTLVEVNDDHIVVACQSGGVALSEIQMPGRKRMSVDSYLAGQSFPEDFRLRTPELKENE